MRTTAFHEGPLSPDIALAYAPTIFNTQEYRELHATDSWLSFHLLDKQAKSAVAGVHFHFDGTSARTPLKAPFGSFDFHRSLNPKVLYRFLEDVEGRLKEKGVREILIVNAPRAYDAASSSLLETFLINQQYSVRTAELACVLDVSTRDFPAIIRPSEKLRRRQAQEAGLTFEKNGRESLEEIFRFLSDCHHQKDYVVSITWPDLEKAIKALPDRYQFFSVRNAGAIVAAAICIRVSDKVLYNFMVNHPKELNHLSPPILLMEGIYGYCAGHSIPLMDMGTSATGGLPNFGLLDFKLRMGGQSSAKLSFYKRVA